MLSSRLFKFRSRVHKCAYSNVNNIAQIRDEHIRVSNFLDKYPNTKKGYDKNFLLPILHPVDDTLDFARIVVGYGDCPVEYKDSLENIIQQYKS